MKYLLLIAGVILSVIGLSYIIIYLNLLVMGYSLLDYVKYIFSNFYCLLFFIGYFLIIVYLWKGKNL